jgi:hypothetical protein
MAHVTLPGRMNLLNNLLEILASTLLYLSNKL